MSVGNQTHVDPGSKCQTLSPSRANLKHAAAPGWNPLHPFPNALSRGAMFVLFHEKGPPACQRKVVAAGSLSLGAFRIFTRDLVSDAIGIFERRSLMWNTYT